MSAPKGSIAQARASVAYWARRAGSARGRQMLAEARARLASRQTAAASRAAHDAARTPHAVSPAGLAFVASFEGFRASTYRDGVGVLTQGYGETQHLSPGKPWTRKYALARMRFRIDHDYASHVVVLAKACGLRLTQGELDALASLTYNLGPGILSRGRTMGEALRSKNRRRIADAFLVYDNPNDPAVHAGLKRRRRAERAMFLRSKG